MNTEKMKPNLIVLRFDFAVMVQEKYEEARILWMILFY